MRRRLGVADDELRDAEAVFGVFVPGPAFPDDTANAYFAGLEFEFSF